MKRVTLIATAILLAVVAVLATNVRAQETNTREVSYLTFSNTVEMPGVTLPAGTYTFRLADIPTRNVVQVLDKDQKKVMGQWLFVQAERPDVTDDTVIMFKENRENTTPAVQFWYFPGEKIGKEFIYPKDQALKIAARTGQKVRTDDGYVTSDTAVSSTDAQGQTAQWQKEGTPSADAAATTSDKAISASASASASNDSALNNAPAGAQPSAAAGSLTGNRGVEQQARQDTDRDVAVTSDANAHAAVGTSGSNDNVAVGTSGQAQSPQARADRGDRLPKTGSELPLAGLIGLLSLAGALGTRAMATVRR